MTEEGLNDWVLTAIILPFCWGRDISSVFVGGHAAAWSVSSDLDYIPDPAKDPSADKIRRLQLVAHQLQWYYYSRRA